MANNGVGSIHNIRKKFHETHELISTSYHEAGHTVYGLLHFMMIGSVSVFSNKKTKRIEGYTHYDSPILESIKDNSLFSELLNSEICISYAGLAAEKYYFKLISGSDKLPMFLRDGSSDDILSAAALINKYNIMPSGRKRYDYKKRLSRDVIKELKDNWEAVTVISHALFRKKKLCFLELKTLLTKKTNNKKFWKERFKVISGIYDNTLTLDENYLKSIMLL